MIEAPGARQTTPAAPAGAPPLDGDRGEPAQAALPDLSFTVESVSAGADAAVPALAFRLRVEEGAGIPVRSVLLHAQLRIQAPRRRYSESERNRLRELFGWPAQWSTSLRSLLWTNVTVVVPPVEGSTVLDVHVPVTYDLEVIASKYLAALDDGVVPLLWLFSGTAFHLADGRLLATQIPWDLEAEAVLPVTVWRAALDAQFPNSAWLRLSSDVYAKLALRRVTSGLTTWDAVVEELLDDAGQRGRDEAR